jgi:hypothetical protein
MDRSIFLIAEVLNNYNFKLQELTTGRILKRPAHAGRLRLLRLLDNDYRLPPPDSLTQVFSVQRKQRNLSVRILVGDMLKASTHAIVHLARHRLGSENAQSTRLFDAAGAGVLQAFTAYVDDNAPTADGQCFITPAGNLTPIRRIAHVITTHDSIASTSRETELLARSRRTSRHYFVSRNSLLRRAWQPYVLGHCTAVRRSGE